MKDSWTWKNSPLKIAAIGTPQKIISSILDDPDKKYVPFVPLGAIRKNTVTDFAELIAGIEDFSLFDEDYQRVREFAGSLQMINANNETLQKVERKLQQVAGEMITRWDFRQSKTKLQTATINAFGLIHKVEGDFMVDCLRDVIKYLPPRKSELHQAESCYPGFIAWNKFWQDSYNREDVNGDLDPLSNVHIYYENWVHSLPKSEEYLEFQKLWEVVMIRSTSEAMCETVGSMMNQHSGKNRHLEPEYFSMEMCLRVNLGPMHLLEKKFIAEVIAENPTKDYIRGETRLSQLPSGDVNLSSSMDTFQKNNEKKARFHTSFWQ